MGEEEAEPKRPTLVGQRLHGQRSAPEVQRLCGVRQDPPETHRLVTHSEETDGKTERQVVSQVTPKLQVPVARPHLTSQSEQGPF